MQHISVYQFYTLKIYWIHWWTIVVFWGYLQYFQCIVSCHLLTMTDLLLFQCEFLWFLFLACLLWIGSPKIYWIKVVRVHSYIFSDLRGNISLFTIEYDISCRFVIYDLYFLKYVPYSSTSWRIFILSGCWTLSKTFPLSIKIIFYFFIISLLLCIKLYHIDHTDLCVTLICGYWKILSSLG